MRRRVLALASGVWGVAALGLVACAGDDTNPPLPDAGTSDATVSDGGGGDAIGADSDAGDANDLDAAACTPFDAAVYTDAEIQAGLKIVLARKCEQCHGLQLQGNQNGLPSIPTAVTTEAEGGIAYPPDLTPDPINGLGCWTNAQIERAFLHGIDNEGVLLCNPMPRFGEEGDAGIDEAGAAAVVAYLRSIPIVVNPNVPNTPACYPPPPPVDAGEDAAADAGLDGAVDAGGDAGDSGDATVADASEDAMVTDAAPDVTDAESGDGSEDAASDGGADAD
jgi:hypothetical protein